MTLIATVLLSAIAATIALVVVRQTVLVAQAESVRGDYDGAYALALDVKTAFERQLAADPQFFTKVLFRYERPRMCTRDGQTLAVVPPEDPGTVNDADPAAVHDTPWPATCPGVWTYLGAGNTAVGTDASGNPTFYDPAQHPVRVEISPPSASRPTIQLRILAAKGQVETGVSVTYRPSSATSVTAYSAADLRLDSLYTANPDGSGATPPAVAVHGALYSGGRTYLPTTDADFAGAQLFAEGGFVGALPDTGRFYAGDADPAATGTGVAHPLRPVVPSPLTMDGLRGAYGGLEAVACPGGTPAATTGPAPTFATFLCLRYGTPVLALDGTLTTDTTTGDAVGARPAAYLLMYAGTADNPTLKVYTAATPPSSVGDCLLQCDLSTLALPDYNAKRHPASPVATSRSSGAGAPLWQPLGELRLPASGVVVTDADTYIGQCPASIGGAAAGCPAVTAARSLTVVAGSPHDPKDIVLSGPSGPAPASAGAAAAHVGLVATRSVVVPFYARAAGTDLNVGANVVAFGFGLPRGQSALRAFPASQAPRGADPANYGHTFTLTGSIAAPNLSAALPGWTNVDLQADPASVTNPPPYFPGFTSTWVLSGATRISPYTVCGLANCSTIW